MTSPTMPTLTRTAAARAELAADLVEVLPAEWEVYPYGVALDHVTAPTVLVVLDRVTRPDELPVGCRAHEFTLWLIEPSTDPGPADDAVDRLVDLTLDVVDEHLDRYSWSAAVRDVYRDTLPAYRLTLTRED